MPDPLVFFKWILIGPMAASAFALASCSTRLILAGIGYVPPNGRDLINAIAMAAVFALMVVLFFQADAALTPTT